MRAHESCLHQPTFLKYASASLSQSFAIMAASRLSGSLGKTDPTKGSISHVSPLARALLGKSIGDLVKAGNHEVEIASIN